MNSFAPLLAAFWLRLLETSSKCCVVVNVVVSRQPGVLHSQILATDKKCVFAPSPDRSWRFQGVTVFVIALLRSFLWHC